MVVEVRAQNLCGVSAGFLYYYLSAQSSQKEKVGTGNEARFKRRAEIAWLQWIFEFHSVYITHPVETGETRASNAC